MTNDKFCTPVFLNLFNSLLDKPRILSTSSTRVIYSIKH